MERERKVEQVPVSERLEALLRAQAAKGDRNAAVLLRVAAGRGIAQGGRALVLKGRA